jgi:hypothetical protein
MTEPHDSPDARAARAAIAEVARLGRLVEELGKRLESLANTSTDLAELREQVAEVSGMVAGLLEEHAETQGKRALWWPDLEAGEERTTALRQLGAWVEDVLRGHYPELYKDSLGSCWYRHPNVLNELTALWVAWYGVYRDEGASSTAAIEWHDRWLPGAMARCKTTMKAMACDKNGHQLPKTKPFYDSDDFGDFTEGK